MIRFLKEGDALKQGLNVYHPKDMSSIGFKLLIKNTLCILRWSKLHKRISFTKRGFM